MTSYTAHIAKEVIPSSLFKSEHREQIKLNKNNIGDDLSQALK